MFFDKNFGILNSVVQQNLEAPQKNAEAPQQILEPPKFHKEPVFQQNATDFCQKNSQKFGVMVFFEPSLQTITLQPSVFQNVESKSDGLWFIFNF